MRRKMMPAKKVASAPQRPQLTLGQYRFDPDGRVRPQLVLVQSPANRFRHAVVIEAHLFVSRREAVEALPKITALYSGAPVVVRLARSAALCNRSELGRIFRRTSGDGRHAPVRFIEHYTESRGKAGYHYEPLDRFAS